PHFSFNYSAPPELSTLSLHDALPICLRVVTVLRFVPASGEVRAFEFTSDPGLVRLDPRWHQAALRFVDLGFFHILDGTDHLLFLDRKSTRLNSSHRTISYAVFCLKKK